MIRFTEICRHIAVRFTECNPYATSEQMRVAVKATGTLEVYTGDAHHPVWTPYENWVFRAVHDYDTHIAHGLPFGLLGEFQAYALHAQYMPKACRPALFTELVGQAAVVEHTGDYPEQQKASLIYGFDLLELGCFDPVTYRRNFS